jgi:hypothetical protein
MKWIRIKKLLLWWSISEAEARVSSRRIYSQSSFSVAHYVLLSCISVYLWCSYISMDCVSVCVGV